MKFTVALIYGGEGFEHDVSLVGAKNLSEMIDRSKYELVRVLITRGGEWFIEEEERMTPTFPVLLFGKSGLFANGAIINIDVAIPLLHGDLGEDGVIAGALRAAHIKYVGCDVLAGALCADKVAAKLIAEALQIPTAKWTFSDEREPSAAAAAAEKLFLYPMFIKPCSLGSSIGISKVKNRAELTSAYKKARSLSKRVLIEEALPVRCELECAYLGLGEKHSFKVGSVLSNGEFYDFDKKYLSDTKTKTSVSDPDIENAVAAFSERLVQAIGIRQMARLDFLLTDEGKIFFNEINTFPGMTSSSLYPLLTLEMGLAEGEFINRLISETLP